mgnify:FL=1|jgi:hypothetical protein|tara:strand:+ start:21614 stop:21829 length:216 start_codon:yes stop_codon:yes gene_type:complete
MVVSDWLGFSDSDYAYNQSRAHSADMFFVKMRLVFWGSCATLSAFLIGNIMGVFDINIMGSLISYLKSLWH